YIYWIGSHSRDKNANFEPNRYELFATTLYAAGVDAAASYKVEPIPRRPYTNLVADLESKFVGYSFDKVSMMKPKKGGLNIEGLSATPDGKLLIGFRSP